MDIFNLQYEGQIFSFDENNKIILDKVFTEPGLYDKNGKIIANWDETKNILGLVLNENGILSTDEDAIEKIGNEIVMDEIFEMYEHFHRENSILKKAKTLVISDEVLGIGDYAFYGCSSLSSIIIPNSVTSIGPSAFWHCSNLTSVTFNSTTGWFTTNSSSETSGESIDITNPSTNATNLKNTYDRKYWKRNN